MDQQSCTNQIKILHNCWAFITENLSAFFRPELCPLRWAGENCNSSHINPDGLGGFPARPYCYPSQGAACWHHGSGMLVFDWSTVVTPRWRSSEPLGWQPHVLHRPLFLLVVWHQRAAGMWGNHRESDEKLLVEEELRGGFRGRSRSRLVHSRTEWRQQSVSHSIEREWI